MLPVKADRVARAEEYREIAEGLRELARRARSLEIRRDLFNLGFRYDRLADQLKSEQSGPVSKRSRRGHPRIRRGSAPGKQNAERTPSCQSSSDPY
jgi:hypothetical protein